MTRLPQIQGDFQSYLLHGDRGIESHVVGTERVPIEARLRIYGDGYRARLVEALQANFPVLSELLGETDFETLAKVYVRSHDSSFFSIRHYGNALADFLATEAQYAGAPVLAELARWEWAMTEVFDAADAEPIVPDDIARLPPGKWAALHFEFHPSVRRLCLAWNAPQLWKAVTDEAGQPEVALNAEPVQWLLWRQELRTYFRSLSSGEAAALDAAREGLTFGELCGLLCAELGEAQAPVNAAGYLREWLGSGLVVAVY